MGVTKYWIDIYIANFSIKINPYKYLHKDMGETYKCC